MMEVLLKLHIQNSLPIARVNKLHPAYYLFLESTTGTQPYPFIHVHVVYGCFHGTVAATDSMWPGKLKVFAM